MPNGAQKSMTIQPTYGIQPGAAARAAAAKMRAATVPKRGFTRAQERPRARAPFASPEIWQNGAAKSITDRINPGTIRRKYPPAIASSARLRTQANAEVWPQARNRQSRAVSSVSAARINAA